MSFRSKVVVRNFPASLSREKFDDFLAPWSASIDHVRFHPGKVPHR